MIVLQRAGPVVKSVLMSDLIFGIVLWVNQLTFTFHTKSQEEIHRDVHVYMGMFS